MPVPFDSAHACCSGVTLLPRSKYILTAGMGLYEYDPIMQQATYLYSIIDHFSAPIGRGISFGGVRNCSNSAFSTVGGVDLPAFNTATWWVNERTYWFYGPNYWRWKGATDPAESAGSTPSITAAGWKSQTGLSSMDGWLTTMTEWSYLFVNATVARYSNYHDHEDFGDGFPQPISAAFPGLPDRQSDSDLSLGGTQWMVWKDNQVWKYHQFEKQLYPGYPRAIHDDAADGGLHGDGRTRCSGTMDLVTAIGFVQDKSPGATFESMPYAEGLACRWVINLPEVLLVQTADGLTWPGLQIRFTRFDLGAEANLTIFDNNDMPSQTVMESHSTTKYNHVDYKNFVESAEFFHAQRPLELQLHNPTVAHRFTAASPPTIGQSILVGGTGSQSVAIEFMTGVNPLAHTGFALEFAIPTPDHAVYAERSGVFWFSSLRTAGEQTVILHPRDLDPQSLHHQQLWISLSLRMYPNDVPAYFDQIRVEAFSTVTGLSLKNCTGASLFLRGYVDPRCQMNALGPVRLVYSTTSASFVGLALGEFKWTSFCNAPASDPIRLSNLTGTIVDGSGPFNTVRGNSNCRWLIEAVEPDVLFVALKPAVLHLDIGDYLRALDGADFDASPTIRQWVNKVSDGMARSTGPRIALWLTTQRKAIAQGFNVTYTMILTPVTSTISIAGFAPIEVTSFEGLATLSSLGSSATAILYAGVSRQSLQITGRDKYNQPAALEFDDAFGFTLRFIPHALTLEPTRRAALQTYPRSLRETSNVTWAARGVTISDAELASIVEYPFEDARLEFVAPRAGELDYVASLLYVIWAPSVSAISGMQIAETGVFTALPYEKIIRVTAFKADSAKSSFYFERTIPWQSVGGRRLLAASPPCLPGDVCNSGLRGANGNFTVGDTALFHLVTRDQWSNRMENLGPGSSDDVRAFLQSLSIASSPPALLVRVQPGHYELRLTPTVAGADYKLTVLVSGSDVSEGPFSPLLLPGPTDAGASTIVCGWTGLSVLSHPLPLGSAVPIIVVLRDRFGNPQAAAVAERDSALFEWPGKTVQLTRRNGSEITYAVSLGRFEPSSRLSVRINGAPLGYDPDSLATAAYATGITVTVGDPEITLYEQSDSVSIGLQFMGAQCMAFTFALVAYVHHSRTQAPIRAAAPAFLQLMLVGAIFLYASIIPMAEPVPSAASCAFVPLLGHLGFFLVFGSLFVKTHRVRTIFQAKKLQVRIISDVQLLGRLSVGILVFLVYYAIWMAVAPPEPELIARDYDGYGVCASEQSVFSILILIVEALFVLYGAYLSASIWSLPSQFNESKQLLVAIYNVAVIGGLLLLLVKGILTDPRMQLLFSAIGILIVTTVVILCIFVQKLALLWIPQGTLAPGEEVPAFGVHAAPPLSSIVEECTQSISPGGLQAQPSPYKSALVNACNEPQGPQPKGAADDLSDFALTGRSARFLSPHQQQRSFKPPQSPKAMAYAVPSAEGRSQRVPPLNPSAGPLQVLSPTAVLAPTSPLGAPLSPLGVVNASPVFFPDSPAPAVVSHLSGPGRVTVVDGGDDPRISSHGNDSAIEHFQMAAGVCAGESNSAHATNNEAAAAEAAVHLRLPGQISTPHASQQ